MSSLCFIVTPFSLPPRDTCMWITFCDTDSSMECNNNRSSSLISFSLKDDLALYNTGLYTRLYKQNPSTANSHRKMWNSSKAENGGDTSSSSIYYYSNWTVKGASTEAAVPNPIMQLDHNGVTTGRQPSHEQRHYIWQTLQNKKEKRKTLGASEYIKAASAANLCHYVVLATPLHLHLTSTVCSASTHVCLFERSVLLRVLETTCSHVHYHVCTIYV